MDSQIESQHGENDSVVVLKSRKKKEKRDPASHQITLKDLHDFQYEVRKQEFYQMISILKQKEEQLTESEIARIGSNLRPGEENFDASESDHNLPKIGKAKSHDLKEVTKRNPREAQV